MTTEPRCSEDGAHIIPIRNVRCAGCDRHAKATGTVRWHPEEGVTFTVEIPSGQPGPFYRSPPCAAEVGRIVEYPTAPRWIAETSDGLGVELYGFDERLHTHACGGRLGSGVTGRAWNASVGLKRESPLSFWNDTPERHRAFFLGFGSYCWPRGEPISFRNGDTETCTTRRSIPLCNTPSVDLYEAGFCMNLPDGGWLTFDDEGGTGGIASYPPASYCSFVSFLNGRMTPIFWRDSFLDSSTLQRTYFRTSPLSLESLRSILPLLPLRSSLEPTSAARVVEQLPALYVAYLETNKTMNIPFVLAPIWSACDSLLTDRFALACVSLERLATAWQESPRGKATLRKKKFWDRRQSCKVRKALKATVDVLTCDCQLTDPQVTVIKRRIDSEIGKRTNEDRLTTIYDDLDLELSDREKRVIAERNHPLHGKPTLHDRSKLREIDDEVLRFDTLRMVIIKAVLALLKYRGPYINYAARLPQRDFPVECLKFKSTKSGAAA